MSFKFDHTVFNNKDFNELIKKKLNKHLNKPQDDVSDMNDALDSNSCVEDYSAQSMKKKKNMLANGITVNKVNFVKPPQVEILDLNIQPKNTLAKSIIKIFLESANIEISTQIEANSLLLYSGNSTPSFIMPEIICNDSFVVPITMLFSNIQLEAISNISAEAHNKGSSSSSGVSISFNDVNLDFDFDCSIKLFQGSIEKRLKTAMDAVFKDALPLMIYSTSSKEDTTTSTALSPVIKNSLVQENHCDVAFLDPNDLEDLSPITMLKLSTMVSQRNSLSLSGIIMNGCLERPNLYKLIQKNSLKLNKLVGSSSTTTNNNELIIDELNFNDKLVENITTIQSSIYNRQGRRNKNHIKRRVISLKKKKKNKKTDTQLQPHVENLLEEKKEVTNVAEAHKEEQREEIREEVKDENAVEVISDTKDIKKATIPFIESYNREISTLHKRVSSPVPALKFHDWVEDHAFNNNINYNNINNCKDFLINDELKHKNLLNNKIIHSSPIRPVYKRNHYSFVGISSQSNGYNQKVDPIATPSTPTIPMHKQYFPEKKIGPIQVLISANDTKNTKPLNTRSSSQVHQPFNLPPPPYSSSAA